ncbi:sensor domain-containing diguanylate cyclase [Vibrio vulnificus]|nr:sensor domain-containing diguanylate cyclase [Vibrio vulnificus]
MESYLGKGRKPPENDAKPHHRREHNDGFAALPLGFLDELAQSSSLEDVLLCTSYWVREIFQADRASITLDENEREMRLYAFDGNDVQPQECLIPIEGTLVGEAFTQQKVVMSSHDRSEVPSYCKRLSAAGLTTFMIAPLKHKGECYGTLNIAHKQLDAYSELDARVLETLANWVAAQVHKHQQINKMIELAHIDPLTGALNRRAFVEATYFINDKPRQYDHKTALLMIDLDKFKAINDAYGHPVGDKVLIEIAQILKDSVRSDDLVARFGGEEFAILLRHVNSEEALRLAELLRAMVEQTVVEHQNQRIRCTISIGIALPIPTDQGFEELMQRADHALYVAKRKGRNLIILSGMTEA